MLGCSYNFVPPERILFFSLVFVSVYLLVPGKSRADGICKDTKLTESKWLQLFLRIFLGFKLKNDYFCTSEVLFGTCTITITLFPPNTEEFSL